MKNTAFIKGMFNSKVNFINKMQLYYVCFYKKIISAYFSALWEKEYF